MIDVSRFRNYGLWISVAALIPMVLQGIGLDILPKNYEEMVNIVLGILVMLGILNNPTTKCKGFRDDNNVVEEEKKIEE